MSEAGHSPHLGFDRLVEYWLGETDDASTQGIDAHLLGCDACGAQLDEIVALAHGVRHAFANGLVQVVVGAAFVARLTQRGVRVRQYPIPRNGSVNCIVAPQDEMLIGRLQAPLKGVSRLDVALRMSLAEGEEWLRDVPFDAASGEVLLAPKLVELRQLPAHDLHIRLLSVDDDGAREIGHYTLHHSPWR